MTIKSKADALVIVEHLKKHDRRLVLHPVPLGVYGNLKVYITGTRCREFWNGDEGTIYEADTTEIVDMLYKYRKAYNAIDDRFLP